MNTRTALGAYHRVEREYEGRLRMGRFLRAYHRVWLCFSLFMRKPVFGGSDLVGQKTNFTTAENCMVFEILERLYTI